MLWTIVNVSDIFADCGGEAVNSAARPSNPYNYIRSGYHLDNASLFGGKDDVDFDINFSGNRAGTHLGFPRV